MAATLHCTAIEILDTLKEKKTSCIIERMSTNAATAVTASMQKIYIDANWEPLFILGGCLTKKKQRERERGRKRDECERKNFLL